jgi:hypothetical protein
MGGAAANAVMKKEEVYLIMATTLSVLLKEKNSTLFPAI